MNKRAVELNVPTLVVAIPAIAFLILSLVLVRGFFRGATESVTDINEQVERPIQKLFVDEKSDFVVMLNGNTANVRQGKKNFGFIIAAAPENPSVLEECKYSITLNPSGHEKECLQAGAEPLKWITSGIQDIEFDRNDGNIAYALIQLNVPNIAPCNQRFSVSVTCPGFSRSSYFQINIIKKGLF